MGMCRRCAGHSRGAAHCRQSFQAGVCCFPSQHTPASLPLPAAPFASPSPVFLGTISAQKKRKREAEHGAKLGGKGPTGVFERVSGCICASHSPRCLQAPCRAGPRCSGWQEVLRQDECCNRIWDLSRSYQDDAEASLCPSCLLSLLALLLSPPCFFSFFLLLFLFFFLLVQT